MIALVLLFLFFAVMAFNVAAKSGLSVDLIPFVIFGSAFVALLLIMVFSATPP